MEISFEAKIWKSGNVHVITLPSDYIKNKLLKNGQKYWVTCKELGGLENEEHTRDIWTSNNISENNESIKNREGILFSEAET